MNVKNALQRNRNWLLWAVASTFGWGLIAHGYGFLHDTFTHDSLSGLVGTGGNAWKISLGRFLVPVYRTIFRTDATLPWMVGLLSLLWIGLAVFLTIRLFQIENKALIVLTAGIFTANITVAATAATYLHDLDGNLFGMLCGVAAVYLWRRVKFGEIPGAVCIAMSMALYQSYISVTIVLIMLACILDILDGDTFGNIFLRGLRGVGMLLLGAVVYSLTLKAALSLSGTDAATGSYNSLDNLLKLSPANIVELVKAARLKCYYRLVGMTSPYPDQLIRNLTDVLIWLCGGALLWAVIKKRIKLLNVALLAVLLWLLPLGMNLTHVLAAGESHDLMTYGVWLFWLLVLLLGDWSVKNSLGKEEKVAKPVQWISAAMVFVLLYSNVQVSNALYLKKDLEQDAHLSMMTRVVYRMEAYEGYIPGETPVVLVGKLDQLNANIRGFEDYANLTGTWRVDPIYQLGRHRVKAYFNVFLANPALFPEDAVWNAMVQDPRVAEMPCYPAEGCIEMIDGILVVKLG